MKRFINIALCIILAISLSVSIVPVTVYASDTVEAPEKDWSGYIPISTKEDLNAVRNDPYGMYYLTNDIVFDPSDFNKGGVFYNGGKSWEPIGSGYVKVPKAIGSEAQFNSAVDTYGALFIRNGEYNGENYTPHLVYYETAEKYVSGKTYYYMDGFYGVLDGNGHTIKNLRVSASNDEHAGLFGVNFGSVNDIVFESISSNTHSYSGSVCGENYGTITNCKVYTTYGTTVSSQYFAGGICGYNYGYISSCEVELNISAFQYYCGGIAGVNSGYIRNCIYTGNLTGNAGVGGICGAAVYSTITESFANVESLGGAEGTRGFVVGLDMSDGEADNFYRNCLYADSYYSQGPVGNAEASELCGGPNNFVLIDSFVINKTYISPYFDYENVIFGGTKPHVLGCASPDLFEQSSVWDGSVATSFESGSGTEDDPYIISNAAQLAYLSDSVYEGNSYRGKFIELSADIILNDVTLDYWFKTAREWYSIGGESHPFEGSFNGNGYTVSGVYFSRSYFNQNGLFGYIGRDAVIENVTCECYLTVYAESAAICGYNAGGKIIGCNAKGYVDAFEMSGLVCGVNEGTVKGCQAEGTVSGGSVLGGICGYNAGEISECKNESSIASYSFGCAGISGANEGSVSDCYNTGDVTANILTAGIVGESFGGSVKHCYNTGSITADIYAGAVCGFVSGTDISECYYLADSSANFDGVFLTGIGLDENGDPCPDEEGKAAPLSIAQLKQENSYEGFEFGGVWVITSAFNYKYADLRILLPAPTGDVNKDKEVNSKDSNVLKRYIAGESVDLDEYNTDINCDNAIDAKDANLLKRIVTGLEN